jgi:hypothetical protein
MGGKSPFIAEESVEAITPLFAAIARAEVIAPAINSRLSIRKSPESM